MEILNITRVTGSKISSRLGANTLTNSNQLEKKRKQTKISCSLEKKMEIGSEK